MAQAQKDVMAALDLDPLKSGPFIESPGRTRRAMNWFFADTDRLFWILQAAGWVGFMLLHLFSVSTLYAGRSPESLTYSATSAMTGFLTTTILLRPAYRFARRRGPALMLLIAGAATLVMTVAMSIIKSLAIVQIFPDGDLWLQSRSEAMGTDNFFVSLIPDIPVNLFLLLAWAGFYFGINYYLTLRAETDRALQSARLADQAQLKMLRYQLNPHFLFNTLNAISTLVLEKDGRQANSMLTQLSSFLRYSLDSDPLQKTTLAEELRALELYLNIERTRFGERLRFVKEIDDEAREALVPSLIMQPAIENAIKYAIAKMESGGEIRIQAKREGDLLALRVCDNGPEAPQNPESLLSDASAGVGLVNMRDRLNHLYGGDFTFELSPVNPTGLCVGMTLPFETAAEPHRKN
ncbi:MAG: histidine kinase [Pseudomonadota bacterium]